MTEYLFELSENDRTTAHEGGATSDDEAKLEAVQFLSDVLRDLSNLDAGRLSVAVLKDGRAICTISAVISASC